MTTEADKKLAAKIADAAVVGNKPTRHVSRELLIEGIAEALSTQREALAQKCEAIEPLYNNGIAKECAKAIRGK